MKRIYTQTSRVVVWIGDDEHGLAGDAISIMRKAVNYLCQELDVEIIEDLPVNLGDGDIKGVDDREGTNPGRNGRDRRPRFPPSF
jgi:hypothetical protein